jgi:hypothetical protein
MATPTIAPTTALSLMNLYHAPKNSAFLGSAVPSALKETINHDEANEPAQHTSSNQCSSSHHLLPITSTHPTMQPTTLL